ncbi:hypothetical protein LAWI1_G007625 [Lachnellula willkommii]|uniref:Uncharacterized protein n=1 Tax=Lachnellula willkommii TaxID=215461 RepID=A0A559M8A2_9HELO|nr:hypothetical protein LAWI1_G007625 [Lachnellula willkommii]
MATHTTEQVAITTEHTQTTTTTVSHDIPTQHPSSDTSPSTLPPVSIPDGRRNSQGEVLKSPTETWKPNMARTQSWNQEDLKRRFYAGSLDPATSRALEGEEKGFTEVREEDEGAMMKESEKHHHQWTFGKIGGYGSGGNTAV